MLIEDGILDPNERACKFRLEFKIPVGSFNPIEIVKQTALGREQVLSTFLS